MATGLPQFPPEDLDLIERAPRATIGGFMTFPSGLKTSATIITLGDNYAENVSLAWAIVDESAAQWAQPPRQPRGITFAKIFQR